MSVAGELLDTLPPGIDEAVAISKVVQFLKSPEYSHFQHIVFDTAPTGHTLRLLTLPDFLDKTIGKRIRKSASTCVHAAYSQAIAHSHGLGHAVTAHPEYFPARIWVQIWVSLHAEGLFPEARSCPKMGHGHFWAETSLKGLALLAKIITVG